MKVITDSRIPMSAKEKLIRDGFDIIELPLWNRLAPPVSGHPDMLLFFADNKIITHRGYSELASKQISKLIGQGFEIILSDEKISDKYPNDILFNCVEFENAIFGNEKHTSKHIIEYAISRSKRFVSVKQGYAKCSVAKISENAAITADKSLYKAMIKNGIDVLLISPGGVTLEGYDYGFIGGATGGCCDKIYFIGDPLLHPDGAAMINFCEKHKKSPIALSSEKLFDGGSLLFI